MVIRMLCVTTPLTPAPHSAAVDKVTKDRVAIKKIPRAFDDVIDSKRVLREIKLLTSFDHENVRYTQLYPFLSADL